MVFKRKDLGSNFYCNCKRLLKVGDKKAQRLRSQSDARVESILTTLSVLIDLK